MAILETVHIVCAVLWLGNFVLTGFWSVRAWAAGETALRVFAAREIIVTDVVFTVVFGGAVTVSGIALARAEHFALFATFWTRTALEIVAAAAVVWLAVLLPLELRMRKLAAMPSVRDFNRVFAVWNAVGWLTTVVLFVVIYLMVDKPT